MSTDFSLQLFKTDIEYLLSMEKLWQTRTPPTPLQLGKLPDTEVKGECIHRNYYTVSRHSFRNVLKGGGGGGKKRKLKGGGGLTPFGCVRGHRGLGGGPPGVFFFLLVFSGLFLGVFTPLF